MEWLLCSEFITASFDCVVGICTCCVGVLDDSFHSQVMTKVRQIADERWVKLLVWVIFFCFLLNCIMRHVHFLSSKYDVTTFALNIKLPSVVLLREYSLLHYLRKNHSISAPYDMKDTLKVSEMNVGLIPFSK